MHKIQVSSNASCSLEEIAEAALPGQTLFFQVRLLLNRHCFRNQPHNFTTQLYVNRDRSKSEVHLDRVSKAGYKAIVLTVDAPVPGKRTRDEREKLLDLPEEDLGHGGAGQANQKGVSVATALAR